MLISTCCGAYTDYPEIDICPECHEHCDWEVIDEDEWELRNEAENQIEEEQINKHLN